MNFADAEKIAAAVLYEGYILYPYRATSTKNAQRWNFGTLYPQQYAESRRPQEPFRLHTECLFNVGEDARLDMRIRFLQLVRDRGDNPKAWEKGIERSRDFSNLSVSEIVRAPVSCDFVFREDDGLPIGDNGERLWPNEIAGRLEVRIEVLQERLRKLSVDLVNKTPVASAAQLSRSESMLNAFVSAHLLLGVTDGEFVSLLETPEESQQAAATCANQGVFPVLVGEEGQRSMMLCSPIFLYDYPKIAPESVGDFFDGTEMDEMLALRVLTLTDEEKQEMRNTDDRARKILERTESLPDDFLMKVHGVIRGLRPVSHTEAPEKSIINWEWDPMAGKPPLTSVSVFGVELRAGNRVRLWPQKKADIIDMALEGKVALIEAIEQDFEDNIQLAVVLDDDPGREFGMMRQPGHRFFFSPEEVEPVEVMKDEEKA